MSHNGKYLYEFGPFRVDPVNRLLSRNGEVVPVTSKVFDILLVFIRSSGALLEKETVMKEVWPDSFVEEGNLARNVSTLRKCLGETPDEHRYIVTIPGQGYRFVAPVRQVWEGDSLTTVIPETLAAVEPTNGIRIPDTIDAAKALQTSLRARAVLIGVALVLGVALGAVLLSGILSNSTPSPPGDLPPNSLAVLPFRPIDPQQADEVLEVGMADALITRLSNLKQVAARSTSAVRRYAGIDQDPVTIGRVLKVDSVLQGTIQRVGDKMRVTAQLVRVKDGASLWAATFDEKFTDIFSVQDSISSQVAGALAVRLIGKEQELLTKRHTENIEAYQFYLRGRHAWNRRDQEGLRKAARFYQQAIEQDPTYAMAYVGMAECYALFSPYAILPARESFPRAEAAARTALEIDDRIAEAHATLGVVKYQYEWDWPAAEKEFIRALELNPNYATARQWYGEFLARQGRFDAAMAEIRRAQELDPLSPIISSGVGWFHYLARQYDQALEEHLRVVELNPNSEIAYFFLGADYERKGMYKEAIAALLKTLEYSPDDPFNLSLLGYTYAMAGQRADSQKMLARLTEVSRQTYVPPYCMALVYVGLRQADKALDALEKAYEERHADLVDLGVDPKFDSIRSEPRFVDLLRRIGFVIN